MTNLKTALLVSAASMMFAGQAMAFSQPGEVMETSDSQITATWRSMTADSGDTIAEACEGFAYSACVREFVIANRSLFPAQFRSEEDFFLAIGVEYIVPIRTVDAAPVVAETLAPNSSLLDIVNGMTLEQERLVAQVAELSATIANQTFGVDDIDGLAARFRQIDASIPDVGPLRTTIQELEIAFALMQSGELTDELKASINAEVLASLGEYETRLAGLEATTITFEARLTGLETTTATLTTGLETANERIATVDTRVTTVVDELGERIDGVEALASRPAFWELFNAIGLGQWYMDNSGKGQALLFGIPLILLGALFLAGYGRAKVLLNRLMARMTLLEGRMQTVEEDVVSVMPKEEDFDWHADNVSEAKLKVLGLGDVNAVTWVLHHKETGVRYDINLGRDEKTPNGHILADIPRRKGGDELVAAIQVENLKGSICKAIGGQRVSPSKQEFAMAAE